MIDIGDRCTNCGIDAPEYDESGRCPLCRNTNGRQGVRSETTVGGKSSTMCDIGNLSDKQLELRRAAIRAIDEHGSARAAAEVLGTNHGVILMARDGKDTPAAYRALGVRKTNTSTVAFHFHDHDLAQAFRTLVDGHEGGRYEWAREQVKENSNENA